MIIEMHCHTREHSPCSRTSAVDLVTAVRQRGADGIVITDHHYVWSEAELEHLKRDARLPDNFILMSGQEVFTADFGDVLVYGAVHSISQGIALADLRRSYPNAALVWAHPYRHGHLPTVVDLMNVDFDAVEIVNPHHTEEENSRAVREWKMWGYRGASGSDIHRSDFAEFYPVEFSCPVRLVSDLTACMKEGRFSPRLGRYGVEGQ